MWARYGVLSVSQDGGRGRGAAFAAPRLAAVVTAVVVMITVGVFAGVANQATLGTARILTVRIASWGARTGCHPPLIRPAHKQQVKSRALRGVGQLNFQALPFHRRIRVLLPALVSVPADRSGAASGDGGYAAEAGLTPQAYVTTRTPTPTQARASTNCRGERHVGRQRLGPDVA